MTTAPSVYGVQEWPMRGVAKVQWDFTASGIGSVHARGMLPNNTVQVKMSATGAHTSNVVIEGTNFGPSGPWVGLFDPTGGALSFTGNSDLRAIREAPLFVRPRAVTVTAGMVINVAIISSRNQG